MTLLVLAGILSCAPDVEKVELETEQPVAPVHDLMEAVRRAEHDVEWVQRTVLPELEEAYQARNRRQGLRAYFSSKGTQVLPRWEATPTWRLGMELVSDEAVEAVRAKGRRIELARTGIVEWFVNHDRGLEHGFTVVGRDPELEEGLAARVRVQITGDLRPVVTGGGRSATFMASSGKPKVRYSDLHSFDSTGKALQARLDVRGCEAVSERCELVMDVYGDAVYPVTIDPLLTTELATLYPDPVWNGSYGDAVAADGDLIAVGATSDQDFVVGCSGVVYIHERNLGGPDNWGVQAKIAPPGECGDVFGYSLAMDGDTLLVGEPSGDETGIRTGAAHIFRRNEGGPNAWGRVARLDPSNPLTNLEFGEDVALHGDIAAVGAPRDNLVYIFEKDRGGPDNWDEVGAITGSNAQYADSFGISVAIDGDTLVVGAPYHDNVELNGGEAYIFERHLGGIDAWGEAHRFSATIESNHGEVGSDVAVSGAVVAISEPGNSLEVLNAGAIWILESVGGLWTEVATIHGDSPVVDRTLTYTGLALRNDTLFAGSPRHNFSQGSLLVFDRNQGGVDNWGEIENIVPAAVTFGDYFGGWMAVSDDFVVATAPNDDTITNGAGAAYIFTREGHRWLQSDDTPDDAHDWMSFGQSLDADDDHWIVGAPQDDTAGSGAGAVYVFDVDADPKSPMSAYTKLTGSDTDAQDSFGTAVAIDGVTVAVGANAADGVGVNNEGATYVFRSDIGGWSEVRKLTASDGQWSDGFGGALSLDSNTLLVGAPSARGRDGSAYIFERNEGGPDAWGELATIAPIPTIPPNRLAGDVTLQNDLAVLSGKTPVIVSRNQGGPNAWGEVQQLITSDAEGAGAVALDGDTILLGQSEIDIITEGEGAAYVFQLDPASGTWHELTRLVDPTMEENGSFGFSVAIQSDAAVIGGSLGPLSYLPGDVHLYRANEGGPDAWGWVGSFVSPEVPARDNFGYEVAIHDDTVLVGARRGAEPGLSEPGRVYAYRLDHDYPPTGMDDGPHQTDEDTQLVVDTLGGVLANDFDVNGDPLTAVLYSDALFGAVGLNSDGSFNYTPDTDFAGPDTFTYRVDDGVSQSGPFTVEVTVNAVNDAPIATDDAFQVDEDERLVVAAPGLLGNDVDVDDVSLTVSIDTLPASGTIYTYGADGSFEYDPDPDFAGVDTFTYIASDGVLATPPTEVVVTVTPVNDAPVATTEAYEVFASEVLTVLRPGVLENDWDVEGTDLSVELVGSTVVGTLTLEPDGAFNYVPVAGFSGSDSFTYTASDGDLSSDVTTVTIEVEIEDTGCPKDTWYADMDGDGFGDPDNAMAACEQPQGHVDNALDCDDDDSESHPAGFEIAHDGVDQDCDGQDREPTLVAPGSCACNGGGGSPGGHAAILTTLILLVRRRL